MKKLTALAVLMSGSLLASAQTAILYQEDFGTTNGGTTLVSVGWGQILVPSGYSGIYQQSPAFDETTLQSLPINTMYFGGSPGPGIFFTTNGAGSGPNGDSAFTSIDPTQYTNLNISLEAQWSYQGSNVQCWFAVQVGTNWYVNTNQPLTTAAHGSGPAFYQSSITYNPAATNWNVLTNTTVVGIGPQASGSLSGNITGVGIVANLTGSGSWNYNNFLITSISNTAVLPPTLVAAPLSQTAYAGSGVSFAVNATGTRPFTYYWFENGVLLTNSSTISGATNSTLTIQDVSTDDSGFTYSVIVSNSAGSFDTSTNSTATLSVNAVPSDYLYAETFPFVGPSPGNYPLSLVGWSNTVSDNRLFQNSGGDGAFFAFEGSATTTAYYATTNSDAGASGLPFPSINPSSYPAVAFSVDIAPTYQPANVTAYFAVQMSGGSWYVESAPIPVNTSTATGTYTTYQQPFSPSAANWNSLTLNATSASIGSAAGSDLTGNITGAGLVFSVITGGGNFNVDNFLIVTDSVAPIAPVITASPFSQTVYAGAGVSFAGTATGSQPLSYFWQKDGNPLTNGVDISGANSNVLTVLNANSNSAGQYALIASNSVGTDSSANHVTTILTVNDLPTNLLYSESFPFVGPTAGNYPVSLVGWAAAIPDSPGRLYQTGAGDGAIFNFEGSPGTTAFYATTTTDTGVSGLPLPTINIASASGLTFAVDVAPSSQPANVTASIAVQINGANWYVSASALPVDTSAATGTFTTVTQAFSATAANWNHLTLTGAGATIGGAATSDLTGNITGVGLVSTFTGAGNFNFDNFQITGTVIPNPGSISVGSKTATTFTLNWTASPNVHLQSATNLTAATLWSDVPGTTGQGSATITETNTQMFFRLIAQ